MKIQKNLKLLYIHLKCHIWDININQTVFMETIYLACSATVLIDLLMFHWLISKGMSVLLFDVFNRCSLVKK